MIQLPVVGEVAAILLGAAFTVAACWCAGRFLMTRLAPSLPRADEPPLSFVVGAAGLSWCVFVAAACGIARLPVFICLGITCIALGVLGGRSARRPSTPLQWRWRLLFLALFVPFSLIYFVQALGPEYSADGSGYHLGNVVRYFCQGGFAHLAPSVYANLSQGMEMLFLFAFAFGRHSAAALVHFTFLVALVLGILSYGRRFSLAPAAVCAALLIYLSPVFGADGTSAYNDVAAGCVVFFVFYLLEIWDAERAHGLLILAGLLAGFAYGIKYTAFPAVVYAVGFTWWRSRRAHRAAIVAACALVMIVPWMAKDWVMAGNPLSPFFNRWFPNPYTSVAFELDYVRGNGIHRDGFTWAGAVTDITTRGRISRSLLGPVFLLTPLSLLALGSPRGRRLLAAALVFAIPWLANVDTRILIPSAVFVALALGIALSRVRWTIPLVLAAHAVLCWPAVTRIYADQAMRVRHFLPREALRIVPEDATLQYRLPGYRVARLIEQVVPAAGRVFSFAPLPVAYTTRDVLVYWESSFNEAIKDVLLMPLRTEMQPLWKQRFEFSRRRLKGVRVVETASDPGAQWNIGEIYVGGAAQARASANPWDAAWALDGNPLTRWRSQEPLRPGMYFDLRFDAPRELDAVEIDCAHDQWGMRLRLQDPSGAVLAAEPRQSEIAPFPDLRAAAVAEIRRRGITHVVIRDTDFGAQDFRDRAPDWGLIQVGEAEGHRLYALR